MPREAQCRARPRIAHVVSRMDRAGVGIVVSNLMEGASTHGYTSEVWCLDELGPLGSELRTAGSRVLHVRRTARRDIGLFGRLALLIRRHEIDIVHCHDEVAWFYGVLGGRLAGLNAVLVTMHGRRPDISKRHLWEQRLLAGLTNRIVSVSTYLREQIVRDLNLDTGKVTVIRNGVGATPVEYGINLRANLRKSFGIPPESLVIGSVGRLDRVKNLGLLVDACAMACFNVPSIHMVFVGDGECREELEAHAIQKRVRTRCTFLGVRTDVPRLLSMVDVYVCSSDYEGISLSILEAMAASLPVVATNVGGNPEVIAHEETGMLVPPRDAEQLGRTIVDLCNDANKRIRLGRAAREMFAREFEINRMVDAYHNCYRSSLSSVRSAVPAK